MANPLVTVMSAADTNAAAAQAAPNPATAPDDNAALVDSLAGHVETVWQANKSAKMRIQTVMLDCLRARRGEYTPDKLAAIRQQGGSEVFMLLPGVKCRAAESWIRDVMFPESGERPYEIDPTAIPEIPPEIQAQIAQIAQNELTLAIQQGLYPTPEKARVRTAELADILRRRVKEEARRRCDRMADEIDDLLTEGDWYKALDECISDFVTLPGCVLKGPVMRKGKRLAWGRGPNGESVPIVNDELTPFFYRVSPLDMYPSGDSSGPQDGDLLEHVRFRATALHSMIGVPGYNEARIRAALNEYKDGNLLVDAQEQEYRHALGQDQWWQSADKPISALEFYGDVKGSKLMDWGMSKEQVPDPDAEYPIVALKVGRFIVRCIINDDPLGRRPYDVESFEKIVGAFWGMGVPQLMTDLTDACNATARALINNLAIASGPMAEIEVDRLAEGEKIEQMYPWRLFQTKAAKTTSPSPAVRWFQPAMNAQELIGVYTYFSHLADDYTGIPAYAYGSSTASGAATTSSGLSQLMTNASRGIKRAVGRFDSLIDGSTSRTHAHVLLYVQDTSLHGDIRFKARGASSLVSREQQARSRQEFLQGTANPFDMAVLGNKARAAVLRAVYSQLGLPVDDFPTDDEVAQAAQAAQQQAMAMAQAGAKPQGGPSPAGGPGQPGMGPPPARLATLNNGGQPAGGLNLHSGAN